MNNLVLDQAYVMHFVRLCEIKYVMFVFASLIRKVK